MSIQGSCGSLKICKVMEIHGKQSSLYKIHSAFFGERSGGDEKG